jgi:filamentous hemagglutinin
VEARRRRHPPQGGGARFPEKPGQIKHIFRDAPAHLADTPANRTLLQGVADDASTTLGTDKFGNVWSARTLGDGTQVWVQTRNGVIQNGGLNQTPRVFNPETGLSSP